MVWSIRTPISRRCANTFIDSAAVAVGEAHLGQTFNSTNTMELTQARTCQLLSLGIAYPHPSRANKMILYTDTTIPMS